MSMLAEATHRSVSIIRKVHVQCAAVAPEQAQVRTAFVQIHLKEVGRRETR